MLHASLPAPPPGEILGGLGFHGTCCPVDKSYQEKTTSFLEICNLSWHGVSPWLLSTADYTHKLTSHLFHYVFLFYPDPGWDLCVPLIGVSQQYARVSHFLVKKTNKKQKTRPNPNNKTSKAQQTSSCQQGNLLSGHCKDLIYYQLPSGYFTFMGWGLKKGRKQRGCN